MRLPKHKGKTLQWVIDNDIEYVKYLLKKEIIILHPFARDEFMDKLKAATPYLKGRTSTLFSRYKPRR